MFGLTLPIYPSCLPFWGHFLLCPSLLIIPLFKELFFQFPLFMILNQQFANRDLNALILEVNALILEVFF